MSRQKLPAFQFEKGILIRGECPSLYSPKLEERRDWHVIGRLESGVPFMFYYVGGLTSWWCDETLGPNLRKKILDRFRVEARYADSLPGWITEHALAPSESMKVWAEIVSPLVAAFFDQVWRAEYLHDFDSDYLEFAVPFAEKDEFKALAGTSATWDSVKKVWKMKKMEDMSAFEKWLPKDQSTATA